MVRVGQLTSDRGALYGEGYNNYATTMGQGVYLSTGGNNHNHSVDMNIKYLGVHVCKKSS